MIAKDPDCTSVKGRWERLHQVVIKRVERGQKQQQRPAAAAAACIDKAHVYYRAAHNYTQCLRDNLETQKRIVK